MKRNIQHRIDDDAQRIFRNFTPNTWSKAELSEDYGIDYYIQVFDRDTDEYNNILFGVQLKGTETIKESGDYITYSIKVSKLKDYLLIPYPIFLVVVDTVKENTYWLFVQKHVNEVLALYRPKWEKQKTVTLKISKNNSDLKPEIIENIASEYKKYCNLLANGKPEISLEFQVKKILDKPKEKIKHIDKEMVVLFEEKNQASMELLELNNDLENSKEQFEYTYKKTKNDDSNVINHIKAILGLIFYYDVHNPTKVKKLFDYIREGLELSKEHDLIGYADYFNFLKINNENIILQYQLSKSIMFQLYYSPIFPQIVEEENNKIIEIQTTLINNYQKLEKILLNFAESNEINCLSQALFEIIVSYLHYVGIIPFLPDDYKKRIFLKIDDLLSTFKLCVDYFKDNHLLLMEYDLKTRYCVIKNCEKCDSIVDEYIKIAEECNYQFYINRAKSYKTKINEKN